MMKIAILGTAITVALMPVAASALISESFETPANGAGSIVYGPDQSGTYGSNPGGPSATAPGFTFGGFSGIIANTTAVFVDTPYGSQAAFLQGYLGNGSQIVWTVSGFNPGSRYELSFASAGSLVVPSETFGVSILGGAPVSFTPGTAYTTSVLTFVPTVASGIISFTGIAQAGNAATALDNLNISVVPEPASWALLIAGFGLTGAAMRRRSTVAA